MKSKTAKPVRRSAAIALLAGVAVGATSAHGATIGAPVTLGAAADNSTAKQQGRTGGEGCGCRATGRQ